MLILASRLLTSAKQLLPFVLKHQYYIAQHALYVDLSTYRLTEPEHTPLFLTRKQRLPITLPTREQTIWVSRRILW